MARVLVLGGEGGTRELLEEVLPRGTEVDHSETNGVTYGLCLAEVTSPADVERLRGVRQRHRQMAVVAVISPERAEEAAALARMGVEHVLTGPVPEEELRRAVRDVLKGAAPAQERLAREVDALLAATYAQNVTVASVAAMLRVNPRTVQRACRSQLGTTFRERLEAYRVEAAIKLLTRTDEPLKRIIDWCGFGQRSATARCGAAEDGDDAERGAGTQQGEQSPSSVERSCRPNARYGACRRAGTVVAGHRRHDRTCSAA